MSSVLVSACLAGVHCRYDGGCRRDDALIQQLQSEGCVIVPVCPEQLGGLPTPRPPAEIVSGDGSAVLAGESKVINKNGADVTQPYVSGAEETLRIAELLGCGRAYLKEKSPACGVRAIQRGGRTCEGRGVAAALLASAGVEIIGADPPTPVA
jgi:uncharacterized protein YbbK (DUF523 family)